MPDKKSDPNRKPGEINEEAMPPIVDAILVFFYISVWVDILGVSLAIVSPRPDTIYRYLPPLLLYACLLLTFPVRNWRRFRGGSGKVSDLLWGYDGQFTHTLVFVLLNFALVLWLSALNDNYANLYFMLFGVSAGQLIRHWKIMWPVVAAEFVAFAIQSGIWAQLQGSGFNVFDPGVAGLALGMGLFIVYMVMISVLITSRVRSEVLVLELRATKTQLEEALQKEKEVAVLRERDRMAREMHDVLGHALVLVAVKIEAAQRLQAVDPQRAAAELEATKELVRRSMAELRASLADLRSPDFEAGSKPLGLALQEWATHIAEEGKFAIKYDLEPDSGNFPVPVQDALWRVGREAVLNVVKHARARNAELNLFTKDGEVFLTVSDDGVGIPHLADGNARLEVDGHYGVRGMRERVEGLGGHLTIKPGREGQGTMVIASVPLPLAGATGPQSGNSAAATEKTRSISLLATDRRPMSETRTTAGHQEKR